MQIVCADIGGTNARFALAEIAGGRVQQLGDAVALKTAEHASLQTAWETFAAQLGRPPPRHAGIAIACPIAGEILKLTNNPWVIRPALFGEQLGLDQYTLINDFGAVGHAVAQLPGEHFGYLAGPEGRLPEDGLISILGPGTGLGVAQLLRRERHHHVIECEGGHADFAPLDEIEDAILRRLRERHRRASIERVVSGPGLVNIYEALAAIEGRAISPADDKTLWKNAIAGADRLATAALERFCLSLGSVAGDLALAHGARAVVIGGGIAPRIAHLLPRSGFASRFVAKGRLETLMATIPVRLITHPQPGLYGAAAAFAVQHGE